MSINIPAETPDESTNPISVEEFERLHPAMLVPQAMFPLASSSACRCVSMILLLTVRPARRICGMTPILGGGRAVLLTPPGITYAKEARDGRRYDVRCAR